MHTKYALARSEDNEPTVQLLTPGRNVKTAGILPAVSAFISQLRPDPNYTYALGTAMSDSWYFGANSNADWYGYNPHLKMNGLTWDPDKTKEHGDYTGWQTDPIVQQRLAKHWPYGYPTFYGANVFAHHKNHDPALGFGDVVFSYWNEPMKRVELVMRVNNRVAAEKGHRSFLEKVHAGKRVDLSMGCKIPWDACEICTDWPTVLRWMNTYDPKQHAHPGIPVLNAHRKKKIRGIAETRIEYCDHMKHQKNQVLSDGRRVFVYNDFCKFFDISMVWIGADRTAKIVWHLGGSFQLAPKPTVEAFTRKSAAMVKEIPGGSAEILHDADTSPEIGSLSSIQADPAKLLSSLATLGIIPTPSEFMQLVLPTLPGGPQALKLCRARGIVFDIRTPGIDTSYQFSAEKVDPKLLELFGPWVPERSSFDPHLTKRLKDPRRKKEAGLELTPVQNPILDDVARKYAGFRVDLLSKSKDIVSTIDRLSTGWTQGGKASPELAGLLLGIGTVVHWMASHLQDKRERGETLSTFDSLMAKNPGFSSLAAIGLALKAAVEADKAGGITKALSKVVRSIA